MRKEGHDGGQGVKPCAGRAFAHDATREQERVKRTEGEGDQSRVNADLRAAPFGSEEEERPCGKDGQVDQVEDLIWRHVRFL